MGVHLLTSCKMFQRGKSSPLWDDATHVESLKSTNFTVLEVSKAFWCGFVWSLSRKLWITARLNASGCRTLDSNAKQTWCYCLICQKSCRDITFRLVFWCGFFGINMRLCPLQRWRVLWRPIRFFCFSMLIGRTVSQRNWTEQASGFNEQGWLPFCGNTCFRQKVLSYCVTGTESSSGKGGKKPMVKSMKEYYSCNHTLHIHTFRARNDLSFCFWQDQEGNVFFLGLSKRNRR